MFAYCRNNPARRRDIPGTTDVDIFDDGDANLLDDDKEISGGKMGNGSSSGSGGGTASGSIGATSSSGSNGSGEGHSGPSPSGDGTITTYRAMSTAEYNNTISSQKFSPGPNSSEDGKFFATTYEDATQWGKQMYANGDFKVMEATFSSTILTSPQTCYWVRLDGIGPAYFFSNEATNQYLIVIR